MNPFPDHRRRTPHLVVNISLTYKSVAIYTSPVKNKALQKNKPKVGSGLSHDNGPDSSAPVLNMTCGVAGVNASGHLHLEKVLT